MRAQDIGFEQAGVDGAAAELAFVETADAAERGQLRGDTPHDSDIVGMINEKNVEILFGIDHAKARLSL